MKAVILVSFLKSLKCLLLRHYYDLALASRQLHKFGDVFLNLGFCTISGYSSQCCQWQSWLIPRWSQPRQQPKTVAFVWTLQAEARRSTLRRKFFTALQPIAKNVDYGECLPAAEATASPPQ